MRGRRLWLFGLHRASRALRWPHGDPAVAHASVQCRPVAASARLLAFTVFLNVQATTGMYKSHHITVCINPRELIHLVENVDFAAKIVAQLRELVITPATV